MIIAIKKINLKNRIIHSSIKLLRTISAKKINLKNNISHSSIKLLMMISVKKIKFRNQIKISKIRLLMMTNVKKQSKNLDIIIRIIKEKIINLISTEVRTAIKTTEIGTANPTLNLMAL